LALKIIMGSGLMRISFNQPAFLPWGGFFGRLLHSEAMVLLDHTQFARGFTYVNRNRLKGPNGEVKITVPVIRKGLGLQTINQLSLYQPEKWLKNFLALLRHFYSASLYLEETILAFQEVGTRAGHNFLTLVFESCSWLKAKFQVSTPFIFQSDLGIKSTKEQLLLDLAQELEAKEILLPHLASRHLDLKKIKEAGFKVLLLRYQQKVYPQFWGPFEPNLSALDLYLCCGPAGIKVIEKSCRIQEAD